MVGAERIELSKLSHQVMSLNPFPFGTYANNVRFDGPYIDVSDKLALKHITDLSIDGRNRTYEIVTSKPCTYAVLFQRGSALS